jgi:hypothetical protein
MKLVTERPFANPEVAVRQLVQASGIEPVQDGRIRIEKINYPFLYMLKGSGIDFAAGIRVRRRAGWNCTRAVPTWGCCQLAMVCSVNRSA